MSTISIVTSMCNRGPEVLEIIDKLLFPSLLNNGRSDMELVIIDDYSPLKNETQTIVEKHLCDLKSAFGNVVFIRNGSNLGFAKSFNRGMFMARGEKLIVANDDLYFPLNSIGRLAKTLDEPAGYLIAGPITNASSAWSFQYCKQAPLLRSYAPAEITRLEKFSEWLYAQMKGRRMTTDNLCGFCFAADPVLLKEFCGFDEQYGYGFYEDTDFVQRIAKAYGEKKIAINLEVFIGHGGDKGSSKTVSQELLKMNYALVTNGIRYGHRWGYWKLLKRIVFGIESQFGKGTISELLPEKIDL